MKPPPKPLRQGEAIAFRRDESGAWRWVWTRLGAVDPIAAFALGISAAYFFVGLGSFGLLDNNEGLYALIARCMAAGGDWIIPQLNGLPYLEKPPLFYYLLALAFSCFGEAEWAARLVSGAAAMGCLLTILWFGRRVAGSRAAGYATLVLGSSLGFIIMARQAMPEMLLTALLSAALLGAYAALNERNRGLLRISLVLLALGTLAKGLMVPVLFVMVFCGFAVARRRGSILRMGRFLADPVGWALFLLISAPWHLLAARAEPDFAWFYFVNEHLLRFLGEREPHDFATGSLWYYLPRLLLFLFPWPAYLLPVFRRPPQLADAQRDLTAFLWIAGLTPVVFFTVAQAKANYYPLVAMPALALVIGVRIESMLAQGGHRLLAIPAAVLVAGLGSFAVLHWKLVPDPPGRLPISPNALALAVMAIVALGIYATLFTFRHRARLALASVALMAAPLLAVAIATVQAREAEFSSRPLAAAIGRLEPNAEVLLFQDFEQLCALPYYLKQPVRIIDSRSDDLRFGQRRGANPVAFVSAAQFVAQQGGRPRLVAVEGGRLVAFQHSPLAKELTLAAKVGRVEIYRERP
jgi:4-amino-4-deoxy-L-arabinose transferase-like glycosyltransferase